MPVLASARLFPIFKAPNGGGLALDLGLRWLYLVLNLQLQLQATKSVWSRLCFLKNLLFYSSTLEKALYHLPLREADSIVTLNNRPVEFFQRAIRNLKGDEEFWKDKDHLFDFHGDARNGICPPVHIIAGWYDFFLHQQLLDYNSARKKQSQTYLTIGNFAHWDIRNYFPIATRVAIDMFDTVLKGQDADSNGRATERKPVHIFVMNAGSDRAGKWANVQSFPPRIVSKKTFHLGAGNRLENSKFDFMDGVQSYTYEPQAKPTPAIGGASFDPSNCGPRQQNRFEQRDDVVVFTSDELKTSLEVCGYINLVLYVRSNRGHTDFVGRLCCVFEDGTSINICDGMMRISPEKLSGADKNCSVVDRKSNEENTVLRLNVEIGVTAFTFQPGQCVRLQICSGAHSRWLRNYGTSEPIENATVMKSAKQTILFGKEYNSRLELPHTDLFKTL